MKNTLFHLCKGVFLAFFILASIACDTPSVTDTPKSTEKTPDEQDTPKVADIGATAEGAIVEKAYANQGIAEVNFKQDSDITDIRGGAFKGNKISQLELPDTVERVGKDAFKGNPLQTLTLGEKLDLTKVQKDAFATSEETLTVVLKKPQPDGIDAEALARVFGKKTVQFEADPTISGNEKTTLDTHVATLNKEGAEVPNLRTVSFYDGETLITQTHGTTGKPVAQPEEALLPSKTGQRIENWYEVPDLSGSAFVFTTAITADMSLYAKWGSAPTVERIAFTSPTKIYKANDVIQVTVTFTEAVAVDIDSGTPKVVLKIGIEDKEAEYQSGKGTPTTLVFEYTVAQGDEDANGIEIVANQLDANGGTIKKASTAIDIPAVLVHERVHAPTMTVDTTAPTVESIAFTSPAKTYKANDVIQVTVTFSEAVVVEGTPQVAIQIGTDERQAVYKSSTDATRLARNFLHVFFDFYESSTETTLVFEYTVQGGDTDKDGIEIKANKLVLAGGSTIKDTAGNDATLAHTRVVDTARKVDTTAPTVETIAFTSPEQIYKATDVIQVTITFSEVVDVDTASGTPKVVLKIGTVDRDAVYQSGKSTPTKLVFEYTVQAGETDENGIEIEQDKLALNGGTITDAVGNTATLAHTAVEADTTRKVDATAPTVEGIAFTSDEKTYDTGDTIAVTVTFSEAVTVDTALGTPQVVLKIGSANKNAEYQSGSGGTALVFEYTVALGDTDTNGIEIEAGTVALDGGTITDTAGNPATLTHTAVAADDKRTVANTCPPDTPHTVPDRALDYAGETPKLTALTEARLPKNTVSIGGHSFQNNALTTLTVPPCVTHIGAWAFHNNHLTSLTIPARVTEIAPLAFANNRLTEIIFDADISTEFRIGTKASRFENNPLTTVTLSRALYEAFKTKGIIPVTDRDSSYFPNSVTTFQTHDGTKLNVEGTTAGATP